MIFICYRGDDEPWAAETIAEALGRRYGQANIFLDHRSIQLGGDFEDVLWDRLAKSVVMIVVVGERWLTGPVGGRKIDSESDFVRRELETALRVRVKLVPVLVDGAPSLTPGGLPESVRPLASRQRVRLRRLTSDSDVKHLVKKLEEIAPGLRRQAKRGRPKSTRKQASAGNRYQLKKVKLRGQTVLGDNNVVSRGSAHG